MKYKLVKIFQLRAFVYIYIFFTFVFKKFLNPKKIIFYSTPDLSDNSWALFKYFNSTRKDYTIIWLCHDIKKAKNKIYPLVGNNNKILIVGKYSINGLFHFLTSDTAFTTTVFYPFVVKGYGPKCINLWHGMPIKKIGSYIGEYGIGKSFVYAISTSTFFSEIIAACFEMDNRMVLPYGNPKNDAFIRSNNLNKNNLLIYFNLPLKTKLVFWMPTFRSSLQNKFINDSLSSSFLEEWADLDFKWLNTVLAEKGISLIIKLHPMDSLNMVNLSEKYSNIALVPSHTWLYSNFDLYDALAVSDGLISDVSSVLIDYLVTKKTIAITSRFEENYKRGLIPESTRFFDYFYNIRNISDFYTFFANLDMHEAIPETVYSQFNIQALNRNISSKMILDFLKIY